MKEKQDELKRMKIIFNNIKQLHPNKMLYGVLRFTVEYGGYYEQNVEELLDYAIKAFKGEDKLTKAQHQDILKDLLKCNFTVKGKYPEQRIQRRTMPRETINKKLANKKP